MRMAMDIRQRRLSRSSAMAPSLSSAGFQGCLRITVGSRDENDKLMEVLDGYSL